MPLSSSLIEEPLGERCSERTVVSDDGGKVPENGRSGHEPHAIGEVMDWARKRLATLSGSDLRIGVAISDAVRGIPLRMEHRELLTQAISRSPMCGGGFPGALRSSGSL